MKRIFINQVGDSNKFWIIEQFGNSYKATWGRIGTEGKTKNKIFSTIQECSGEIEKLIKDKLKKGYKEINDELEIPNKPILEFEPMNEDTFWEIISLFNWKKTGDDDAVLKPALKRLISMKAEDIQKFAEILAEKLYQLDGIEYASNIGSESYQGDSKYFSPDNFLYVRCCVVANGKDYYYSVLENPTNMPKDIDFEALLYLSDEAYNKKMKTEDGILDTKHSYETFSNMEAWKAK